MKDIQEYCNEEFGKIRAFQSNGQPWFCLVDICKVLGLEQTSRVKERLNKDGVTTSKVMDTLGRIQLANFVDESNLYKVIFQSRKSEAEKFTEWVTSEVLPSIRKHGMYAVDELLDNPDVLIAVATKLKEERVARLEAEKQRDKLIHQGKLYTTGEIAKELGLSSATKLNGLLAEMKIQYKQNNTWLLYSKYCEKEYISIKQQQLDSGKIIYDRKWTGIGRDFILEKFKERGEIL